MRLFVRSYLSSSVTWLSAIGAPGAAGRCYGLMPFARGTAWTRKYEQLNAVAMLTDRRQQDFATADRTAWKFPAARWRRNLPQWGQPRDATSRARRSPVNASDSRHPPSFASRAL